MSLAPVQLFEATPVRSGAVPGEAAPTHLRLAAVLAATAHPTPAEVA